MLDNITSAASADSYIKEVADAVFVPHGLRRANADLAASRAAETEAHSRYLEALRAMQSGGPDDPGAPAHLMKLSGEVDRIRGQRSEVRRVLHKARAPYISAMRSALQPIAEDAVSRIDAALDALAEGLAVLNACEAEMARAGADATSRAARVRLPVDDVARFCAQWRGA